MLSLSLALLFGASDALACGGLFCDAGTMEPVDQKAERILFRDNGDGTLTTFVEITYVGIPEQFAWVLPIPEAISADDVQTWDPSLFDALEAVTAPRFSWFNSATRVPSLGCRTDMGLRVADFDVANGAPVDVVDQFSVGPFALQILEANDGTALQSWLVDNGYDLPDTAIAPLQHYVDDGLAFMAVKLITGEVDEAPLDTLSFTYAADHPMIPLILTSIGAIPDMPILAYVAAPQPMAPGGYYGSVDFDWDAVTATPNTQYATSYVPTLKAQIDAMGGHAFVQEFAGDTESVSWALTDPSVLPDGLWVGRFRTYLDPEEMTADPSWVPAPDAEWDVSNVHAIDTKNDGRRSRLPLTALPTLALGLLLRRRRHP